MNPTHVSIIFLNTSKVVIGLLRACRERVYISLKMIGAIRELFDPRLSVKEACQITALQETKTWTRSS